MIKIYDWVMRHVSCCGCVIGFAFLPVMAASGVGAWAVLT